MAIDLDDLLRTRFRDLVDETRGPLEGLEHDVRRRVGRRRRRRRMGAGGAILAVLAVILAAPTLLGDESTPEVRTNKQPIATTPQPIVPAQPVGIEKVEAYGGTVGTKRIVVHFDAPIPTDAPTYVDDIEHPDAPGIAYTTQDPSGLKLCQNTHWFPGEQGTVDILIPTAWLEPETRGDDIPFQAYDNPAKVPICGGADDTWPLPTHIQIAIWGPESDNPDDITATITPGGKTLVVEIRPPS
jgi:hypothetical protein